jgi:hypothetical protein
MDGPESSMILKSTIPMLATALLCACQPEPVPDDDTPLPDATAAAAMPITPSPSSTWTPTPGVGEADPAGCGADKLGKFLNLLPTGDVKTQIQATVGADIAIRYIAPGDVVTQDLRANRLNVETGEDGRIKQFRCY